MKVFVALFLLALSIDSTFGSGWGYSDSEGVYGPAKWGLVNAVCDGKRQSPINIIRKSAVPAKRSTPIVTTGASNPVISTAYTNNGHGYAGVPTYDAATPAPTITGGPLGTDVYRLVQFHLHWPAEHRFNGVTYAAEMHYVHVNTKYADFATAAANPDGLAVVGFLMKETAGSAPTPDPAIQAASSLVEYESTYTDSTNLNPVDAYLPDYGKLDVWSYLGSLTTPGCNEAVTWLVSKNIIPIYADELALLEAVKDDESHPILHNNRPAQPLNKRRITTFFD